MTCALERRPRSQPGSRASRRSSASASTPAATRKTRAHSRKSGQRETTETSASRGGTRSPASDSGIERVCRKMGVTSGGSSAPHLLGLAVEHDDRPAREPRGVGALLVAAALDAERGRLGDLGHQDFAQTLVGLDDEEVVGRLKAQPVLDARLHVGERVPLAAREREEGADEPVEFEPRVERRLPRGRRRAGGRRRRSPCAPPASPARSRSPKAALTVFEWMRKRRASSRVEGRRWPGFRSPLTTPNMICRTSCSRRGTLLFFESHRRIRRARV